MLPPAAGREAQLDGVAVAELAISGGSGSASSGRGGGGASRSTSGAAVPFTRQARTSMTGSPSTLSSPSSSSTDRPGPHHPRGDLDVGDRHGAQDLERRAREHEVLARLAALDARPSSAAGGPACWNAGSHGPRVCGVERKRPSPSGS